MSYVDAIFRHGVFEPLQPVNLPEEQRVRLNIEATEPLSLQAWLKQVRAIQADIEARHGTLPDSTPDIAADRAR